MFKEGQQADVTVAFDSLEKSHVSVAWVQFYVIIKDIRHRLTTDQQVHQLLVTWRKNVTQKAHSMIYLFTVASLKPHLSAVAVRSNQRRSGQIHILSDPKYRTQSK